MKFYFTELIKEVDYLVNQSRQIQNFEFPWVKHLVLFTFRIVKTTYLNELLKYGQLKPIMENKISKPIIIHLKLYSPKFKRYAK